MQDVLMEDMTWWWQQITGMVDHSEVVFLRDIVELPKDTSAERQLLLSQQLRSMFGVPIRVNQHVIGFFGVDSVTERDWREGLADLLLVISNLLSSVLGKNQLEQEVITCRLPIR
jgi:GAF domain-containing protein